MAADNMQKIKLLKLYELLRKETDEQHPISRVQLCRRLNEMGISRNVRTLSLDIRVLRENGYEILSFLKDKEKFYYVPERELSVPEIKVLIDALQAASFITEGQTYELVRKVAAIAGDHKAEIIQANMVYFNTRKHTNEAIFRTVEGIEDAILRKKKITFNYFHLNENAKRNYVTTDTGEIKGYCLEPVALVFNDDNYYLMAYSEKHPDTTASYRIDRMDNLEVIEDSEISEAALALTNRVSEFTEQAFKMYGGELEEVVLRFDKSLIEPVFDKFGETTPITQVDETTFTATVQIQVSPTFFGWLVQFGGKMKVISPESVIERFREYIYPILE